MDSLPPCNRYIATHDSSGKSVYEKPLASPPQSFNEVGTGRLARSYAVATVPAKLANDEDLKAYLNADGQASATSFTRREIVMPPDTGNGANLLVVDLAPGGVSALHRTVSIDFSICVIGEIEHELDSGEKVKLRPGDHIVQRGTNHRWINASKTEPARFVAVTLQCEPFDIAGKALAEEWTPDESEAKI